MVDDGNSFWLHADALADSQVLVSERSVAACAGAAELTCDAARFAARADERFPFLHPDTIRDANKKRPGQPGYNPRTLHIPPDWFKKAKVSEGQRQWWDSPALAFHSLPTFPNQGSLTIREDVPLSANALCYLCNN